MLNELVEAAISSWLSAAREPLVVGICGAQGSGKSTLSEWLRGRFTALAIPCALLSLDDLYLARHARAELAARIHPLYATRGAPGTHDTELGARVLDDLISGNPTRLPRFDKANDEPFDRSAWPTIDARVRLVIIEGWCVGARPEAPARLRDAVNDLERDQDPDARWRTAVNAALAGPYAGLFARIDRLILLAAPDFAVIRRWRTEQEKNLREQTAAAGRTATRLLSDSQVAFFIQHFERITSSILAEMPARADLTLYLDDERRVVRTRSKASMGDRADGILRRHDVPPADRDP